jgi:hypothetical protein
MQREVFPVPEGADTMKIIDFLAALCMVITTVVPLLIII